MALALRWWAGFAVGFAATVLAVHRVLARRRGARAPVALIAIAIAAVVWLPSAAPLAVLATTMVAVLPSPKRLRTVGFVVVGGALISLALS
jgi:hypothetical protein